MSPLFGTDGIRAQAGEYPLDRVTVWQIGRALASGGPREIVVGRDTRDSGSWIEECLCAGILAGGGNCSSVGILPTPGLAFLTRKGPFQRGIMISASHNPYQDNGIKIFSKHGFKLSDDAELQLERSILRQPEPSEGELEGRRPQQSRQLQEEYLQFLVASLEGQDLAGLKVAIDAANGAAFELAPRAFRQLGVEVVERATDPTGRNINAECGALHPESLAELAVRQNVDMGLALDGDADRAILVDAEGKVIDGDYLLLILARDLLSRGLLASKTVVGTVMANMGLEIALKREGVRLLRTQVGDRYVLEVMRQGNHDLGGEQSGHIILRRLSWAGDGVLTGLQIASILKNSRLSLSRLCQGLEKFPQELINVRIREKPDFMQIPRIRKALDQAQTELDSQGRILIRYSGTEPKVRVMVEGRDGSRISAIAGHVADLFRQELG